MKMRYFRILGAAMAALLPACGGGGGGGGPGGAPGGGTSNPAFPVTMTEPSGGQTFTAPATISMSAVAADPASVAKVEFLQVVRSGRISQGFEGTVIASFTQPPFQASATDLPAGIDTLVARMTDTTGAQTFSNSVTITVLPTGESPGGWMPIATLPPGTSSIWFVDANRGWAVGFNGLILHTEDGGATWVPQFSGTSEGLFKVQFVDPTHGWVIGFNGPLLRTTDGGATWTSSDLQVSTPSGSFPLGLNDLSFVDSDTGWIVGGNNKVLVTKDGGVTWTPLSGIPADYLPVAVHFVDRLNGWVMAGGSVITHTTDGGLTWTDQIRMDPDTLGVMDFVNTTTGWVARSRSTPDGRSLNNGILSTSDGGATWTVQTYFEERPVSHLEFVSPTQGWAIPRFTTTIIHTEDGGVTWTTQPVTVTTEFFKGLRFVDADHGWLLCGDGLLLKTTTGGKAP